MEHPDNNMQYLFVYGLLRRGFQNRMAELLNDKATWIGKGFVYGDMFDLGNYPAVILSNAESSIYGDVYLINHTEILDILDEFEGIGPSFNMPYEYLRKKTKAFLKSETIECWVYEYQWPLENKKKIISGDYVAYLSNV